MEFQLTEQTEAEYREDRKTSRAIELAKELSKERKRLRSELDELQVEFDSVKPTTPTGTLDWYVKWAAQITVIVGVFMLNAGFTLEGQILYTIASIGWIYVGMIWGDRAIMIGSAVTGTATAMNLVASITGV